MIKTVKNSWGEKYGREKKQAGAEGDQVPDWRKMNRSSTSDASKTLTQALG